VVLIVSSIRHLRLSSRKQTRTLSRRIALGRANERSTVGIHSVALEDGAQVESHERRSGNMTHKRSKVYGPLTPEQAREGHRWIRLTVLAAVLQAWMMAAVVALLVPHLLSLFVALGIAYSLGAPLLRRYLNRDVERRVIGHGSKDSLAQFVRAAGMPSSARLDSPRG